MKLEKKQMGLINDIPIIAYTLTNDNGIVVEALNLGGTITKILTPDDKNNYENIVLAYKDLNTYLSNPLYFGSIIGRTAGRIAKGEVYIDEKIHYFYKNNNGNTLHGGKEGFNKKIWQTNTLKSDESVALQLSYSSKDGEEGYPGNLRATVIYQLNNSNELTIEYKATTDQKTLVNLTNHSYFNLSGNGKRDILGHFLSINSDWLCELDESLIPTGRILPVENTPFNFKTCKMIGEDIESGHFQLEYGKGYDHPWILNHNENAVITFFDPVSTRAMDIKTNQKAVVFYSMNMIEDIELSNGENAKKRYAACFETQNLPIGKKQCFIEDSILEPNKEYYHKTVLRFYNQKNE